MKRRVTLRFKIFLLLICVAYAAVMFINQATVIATQNEMRVKLEAELASVRYEHTFLTNKLDYIASEEYIEEAARNRFGWIKDGEKIFVEDNSEKITLPNDDIIVPATQTQIEDNI